MFRILVGLVIVVGSLWAATGEGAEAAVPPTGTVTTKVVWREGSTSTWYYHRAITNEIVSISWGVTGDKPVPGDFSSDGRADAVVWRPSDGKWYIRPSDGSSDSNYTWGQNNGSDPDDIPVMGDYGGDARNDYIVWRPPVPSSGNPATYYLRPSSVLGGGSDVTLNWGLEGDIPVTGDFDGDGKHDMAVWRPSTYTFWVRKSSDGQNWNCEVGSSAGALPAGSPSFAPALPDLNGDGATDFVTYLNGTWRWQTSCTGTESTFSYGTTGDIPVAGHYSGTATANFSVWRPGTSGQWHVKPFCCASGYITVGSDNGGATDDVPFAVDFEGPVVKFLDTDFGLSGLQNQTWFNTAKAAGYEGFLTTAHTYWDSNPEVWADFDDAFARALTANMWIAAYGRPVDYVEDALEAIDAAGYDDDIRFFQLDVEYEPHGCDPGVPDCETTHDLTSGMVTEVCSWSVRPVVYTSEGMWEDPNLMNNSTSFSGVPLHERVSGAYDGNPSGNPGFGGWTTRVGEQYTTTATVSGITVDENSMYRSFFVAESVTGC